MSERVIFLDRDGVINRKAPEHRYIETWSDFHFLPGAIEAVAYFCQAGYRVAVVTNQRGISLGCMTNAAVDDIHAHMCQTIQAHGGEIAGVFVCPHEKDTCHCRKPEIGLFLQAESLWKVDKNHSWMIGDSESDILAGKHYGIKTALIGTRDFGQDLTALSLLHAADQITKERGI